MNWLNDIFEWFWELFPRLELLNPTEGGVKFKPGAKTVLLKPGHLYWYWPVTTEVHTLSIKRQTIMVEQVLTTFDGIAVIVKTVIAYVIDDVEKALVETTDFDDTISEIGQKGTVKAIAKRRYEDILDGMVESNDLRNEVTQGARSALHPFGVRVIDAFVSSFAETKVFTHNGDAIAFGMDEDE